MLMDALGAPGGVFAPGDPMFRCNCDSIQQLGPPGATVAPSLAAVVVSLQRTAAADGSCVLRDPLGSARCTVLREALEAFPELGPGAAVLLSSAPLLRLGGAACVLCVTRRSVAQVFVDRDPSDPPRPSFSVHHPSRAPSHQWGSSEMPSDGGPGSLSGWAHGM